MKEVTLKDLGTVTTGFTFRKKIEADPSGGFLVIQGKNIRKDRSLDTSDLTPIRLPSGSRVEGKLIELNDILVMCRGDFPYATHITESLPPTVAQNSFSSLRLHDPTSILPAYLTLILNQSLIQNRIRQQIRGTNIPYLSIEALRNLRVPLQPIEKQASILALHNSIRFEQELHRQLETARLELLDALILSD